MPRTSKVTHKRKLLMRVGTHLMCKCLGNLISIGTRDVYSNWNCYLFHRNTQTQNTHLTYHKHLTLYLHPTHLRHLRQNPYLRHLTHPSRTRVLDSIYETGRKFLNLSSILDLIFLRLLHLQNKKDTSDSVKTLLTLVWYCNDGNVVIWLFACRIRHKISRTQPRHPRPLL